MKDKRPSGLLSKTDRPFSLQRFAVEAPLAMFIDYFWVVQWSLPIGQHFESENLPYPCVHLVYEPGNSGLFGPVKGCFKKRLSGQSEVIGCRFKSGYFYPWLKRPVSEICNQQLDTGLILPYSSQQLEQQIAQQTSIEQAVKLFSRILLDAMPDPNTLDERAKLAHNIVTNMEKDRALLTVEQICTRHSIPARQLERLFHQYVGLSPKWVLRMYRLQQLADEITRDKTPDWSTLAQNLGYFDQSHCIRDFKKVTGKPPSAYC